MNDHDLLIKIDSKLTSLCSQFQEVKKENKEDHDKIWTGIEKIDNKKLGAKIFYWMMPFVILGLITVAGIASSNRYNIGKIEKAVEIHMKTTEKKNIEIKVKQETGEKDAITEPDFIHE